MGWSIRSTVQLSWHKFQTRSTSTQKACPYDTGAVCDCSQPNTALPFDVACVPLHATTPDNVGLWCWLSCRECQHCIANAYVIKAVFRSSYLSWCTVRASRFCTPFTRQAIIQQRRREGCSDRTDTLSEMIRNSASVKSGGCMTDSEICDQCITLILSAFETTTGLAGVALYMVSEYPKVEQCQTNRSRLLRVPCMRHRCYTVHEGRHAKPVRSIIHVVCNRLQKNCALNRPPYFAL